MAVGVVTVDNGDASAVVVVGLSSPVLESASSSFVDGKLLQGNEFLEFWGLTMGFFSIAESSCCCGRRYGCGCFRECCRLQQ